MTCTLRVFLVCLVMLPLLGCYIPVKFDAEITLSRTGNYGVEFAGYIADATLYQDLVQNKLTAVQERDKAALIKRDLLRDSSMEKADYYRTGHFDILYKRVSDILRDRQFTFIRRNEEIITLAYDPQRGAVTVRGKSIGQANARRLRDMGLWVEGEIRLRTDGPVFNHNATTVREGQNPGETLLVWTISSPYDPAPTAVIGIR
ncbi:MAG: hypothetical protein ACPGO3_13350 [Magnetospiraceae bacterium]